MQTRRETITTEGWPRIQGEYLYCDFEEQVGEMDANSVYPCLHYEDKVDMTVKFHKMHNRFNLEFIIEAKVDSITDRKEVESRVIEYPLSDMQFIRKTVEDTISEYSEGPLQYDIDCNTQIRSYADYKCSPETTAKVMTDD